MMIKVKNTGGKIWYLFSSVMASRHCMFTPTRAEMRRLFAVNVRDRIYVVNPQGNLTRFTFHPAQRGRKAFSMGCQSFDAKNGAIIREWAMMR